MSDINEMNVGMRWYVIHTYSGYENKVMISIQNTVSNRGLGEMISKVVVPIERTLEKKGDKEVEVEHKLFPGYVLVKMVMTDETWHVVRNITGCTGFVGPGSRPTPLTDTEVADLGLEGDAAVETAPVRTLKFAVGDSVEIRGGVFDGYSGIVSSISDDLSKASVMIKRGRRDIPIELETEYIYPAK